MPKFKNVDVHDRFIPALVRTVKSGDVVDVPDDMVAGFTVGEGEDPHPYWEAVDAGSVTPSAPSESASPAPVEPSPDPAPVQ